MLLCLALGAALPADATAGPEAVRTTEHFAFFSDFETNLNDALIAAGLAKTSSASACVKDLAEAERAGWNRAVDYYAGAVSSRSAADRNQTCIRLGLAGIVKDEEWENAEERKLVETARKVRAAAAPAYKACRWEAQDRANRRWIEALAPLLDSHETPIAAALESAYRTPWAGLPMRVDVVETVEWSGAHTQLLRPTGAHILISGSKPDYQGDAALELLFHEASHFLTGRDSPLRKALEEARREAGGDPVRSDLVHAVHFYMTGEIVRRRLRETGVDYTPYMYAHRLFHDGGFVQAIETTWPAYLDGGTPLSEAARLLVRALQQPVRQSGLTTY